MSQTAEIPLRTFKYKAKKEDLITLVSKCQERVFSDEIDFLEQMGGEAVLEDLLGVDFKKGIHKSEVEDRAYQYGSNKKAEVPLKSFFQLVCASLEDFTLRVLLLAAAVSIVANMIVEEDHRDLAWIEGFAIFMAVCICSLVQAGNDYQKERQFRKLNEFANSKKMVTVWRDGDIMEIHESELVTGDVIKLNSGMEIPADIFVIEAHEMSTDESAMTGETDPIKKRVYKECIAKRDHIIAEGGKNSAGHHDVYSPICLSGTQILQGEGRGVVLVVGADSCVGRIQTVLVAQEASATPLQQKLETVAGDIGKFGLVSAILTLVVLIIRFLIDMGRNSTWGDGEEYLQLINFFIISVTVVVVAIPEGLPLAVTLSLAFSVKKMLKDKNLVRRLQATETMGGANNICSDKTGTLTQNKMTLTTIWNGKSIPIESYEKGKLSDLFKKPAHQDLIRQALGCNGTATLKSSDGGSKTEIALLEFLVRFQEDYEQLRSKHCPENFRMIPFTSQRKRMSTLLENVEGSPTTKRLHMKGASEMILACCNQFYNFEEDKIVPLTEDLKAHIEEEIIKLADQALRTICIAYKDVTGNEDFESKDDKNVHEIEKSGFILIGVLGIRDILRKEVKAAVAKCKTAGIKVRMVTGDNKITARAIARECGIIDPKDENSLIMEGPEFIEKTGGVVCKKCRTKECDCPRDKETAKKKNMEVRVDTIANKEAFDKIYKHLDVLARSRPDDKYALVTGLIERGCVVAVTGDGTNDAPALKKADVGFAMNSGTAVAKEAADIILIDDNFASIVEAAKWGRNIYDNIKKFLQFQLTVNVVAVCITLIGAAILKEAILKAVNMLWVNLIMDTLASLALATEPPNDELLNRKPHDRDEYIISKKMMKHILGQAVYQLVIILVLTFSADKWMPETLPWDVTPDGKLIYRSENGKMRSGRAYFIKSGEKDYEALIDDYGPSRHFTVIFNAFVAMQIFNFLNARKLRDEINIFKSITNNPIFLGILSLITILQYVLGNFGGRALNVSTHGMSVAQWFICIAFGAGGLVWSVLLKVIPINKICPKLGNKLTDPLSHDSKVLGVRRSHRQETLTRKYSSITPGMKTGSLSKVQYHAVPQS